MGEILKQNRHSVRIGEQLPFVVISLVMIVPIAIYSLYSIPAADDFSNSIMMQYFLSDNAGSYLLAAADGSAYFYTSTSGYYFAVFLNYFCSPFLRAGVFGIRAFNCFGNILFFITLFYMTRSAIRFFVSDDLVVASAIFATLVFCLVNNYMNSEIYCWYCVVVGYIVPLSFLNLMVSFYIKAIDGGGIISVIGAAVCGFLVSGSSLNVVVLNCGISILLLFIGLRRGDKSKRLIIITIAIMIGAVINCIAPGNFARHDAIDTQYNIMQAVLSSLKLVVKRMVYLVTRTPFLVIIIAVIMFTFCKLDLRKDWKCSGKCLFASFVLFFFGVFMVDLPVVLGYSTSAIPERTIFVQDVAIYFLTFTWCIQFALWMRRKRPAAKPSQEFIISVVIACLLFCCGLLSVRGIDEWTTSYMYKTITNGSLSDYAEYELTILKEIESSPEKDVVIHRSEAINKLMTGIILTNDVNNYVNTAISTYYNKDTVVMDFSSISGSRV